MVELQRALVKTLVFYVLLDLTSIFSSTKLHTHSLYTCPPFVLKANLYDARYKIMGVVHVLSTSGAPSVKQSKLNAPWICDSGCTVMVFIGCDVSAHTYNSRVKQARVIVTALIQYIGTSFC